MHNCESGVGLKIPTLEVSWLIFSWLPIPAKDDLTEKEVIVIGDFSENNSYTVKDAIQGFHWENSQYTIHPLYYTIRKVQKMNFYIQVCFLSSDTKHRASLVYMFLCNLIHKIKKICPTLEEIYYFRNGCAGQYKIKYNFLNICKHYFDNFGVICEWQFFTTSHEKKCLW